MPLIAVSDSVGERERLDADFHIDRPVVRHMLPIELQVYHGPCENGYHYHLVDSPDLW